MLLCQRTTMKNNINDGKFFRLYQEVHYRKKYIGLCVKEEVSFASDTMHIAHFSIVKSLFDKYAHLISKNRRNLEETANWMNAYEDMCIAINKDILGIKIAKDSFYSMDLARYLEQIYYEKKNLQKLHGNII